ncbi:hypothetical protein CERSUDRAFT_114947, partial [Gelatoporia subvermispora B]
MLCYFVAARADMASGAGDAQLGVRRTPPWHWLLQRIAIRSIVATSSYPASRSIRVPVILGTATTLSQYSKIARPICNISVAGSHCGQASRAMIPSLP